MARIAGVDFRAEAPLGRVPRLRHRAGEREEARGKGGVDHTEKDCDLTEGEINHLRQEIEKEGPRGGDLARRFSEHPPVIEFRPYRGIRHRRKLRNRPPPNLAAASERHSTRAPQGPAARRGGGKKRFLGKTG